MREICAATTVNLEAFVHGALCVSYSGQCYASQACFGRNANRGACAQFCRLPFDLVDANNEIIKARQHLLSLKDMNRSNSLEEMMDAGISSFKIEGRLKDETYVKNVTAHYRKAIDAILANRPEAYVRSSQGKSAIAFTPMPAKSFNRGFTDYILYDRQAIHNFATPKAMGEPLGYVKRLKQRSFILDTAHELPAGDGLCYLALDGSLQGMRINRVEGKEIFLHQTPLPSLGAEIFRNTDYAF